RAVSLLECLAAAVEQTHAAGSRLHGILVVADGLGRTVIAGDEAVRRGTVEPGFVVVIVVTGGIHAGAEVVPVRGGRLDDPLPLFVDQPPFVVLLDFDVLVTGHGQFLYTVTEQIPAGLDVPQAATGVPCPAPRLVGDQVTDNELESVEHAARDMIVPPASSIDEHQLVLVVLGGQGAGVTAFEGGDAIPLRLDDPVAVAVDGAVAA